MILDLEYVGDIVLLRKDPDSFQDLLCSLVKSATMFGMRFGPPKCKMMLRDWVWVTPNLSIGAQFIYMGSCIARGGSIAEELSPRIQKARPAYSNLHHLWRRNGIKLSMKGKIYSAAMHSVWFRDLVTEVRIYLGAVNVRLPLPLEYW